MTSTYAQNSGITLMGTGDQNGTWGDTTNLNLQIIDRLTNGVGAIALSGTTYTLTTADGTLNEGQYKVLVFGGSPSGTNTVTVSPNTRQHFYVVKNSSGQSVIMTQGSGGNVTIANGASKIVYCDGAGATAAVVDVTSTLSMSNATITGGTITGITSLAVTGQASFADGSASAPSIAHTGDLNAGIFFPAADTVAVTTSGTEAMRIDSSGNVGIGTSSPGAKLEINAGANTDLRINTSASGYLQVGQFANGAFIGTSSTDATAGVLRLGTGATERMRIDASGNVGIGGAATERLKVFTTDNVNPSRVYNQNTGTAGAEFLAYAAGTSGAPFARFGVDLNGSYFINGSTTLPTIFYMGSSERLRIGSAGQIGIGGANYGTSGQVLTSGGSGAAPSWANAQATNVQTFTSSGTWTKPDNAKLVFVRVVGGGGGGASGQVSAAAAVASGGGAGSGSGQVLSTFDASDLPSTVTITVAGGGAGGAAQGTSASAGSNGTAGGTTSFGAYLSSTGGSKGGDVGNLGCWYGSSYTDSAPGNGYKSGTVLAAAGSAATDMYYGGMGGGAGGLNSSNVTQAGAAGGGNTLRGTSGGAAGASLGAAGSIGGAWAGGGGGYGGSTASNGGAGGNGGYPGGGGGGGGGTRTTRMSGAGGTGGAGYVEVYTW